MMCIFTIIHIEFHFDRIISKFLNFDDFGALNISSCIKNELGIAQSNDLIKYVNNQCENSNSALVIFIDEFKEQEIQCLFKKHFFKRLHDFIEEIENSHIKLVIGLKSIDWVNFIESKG